MLPLPLPKQPGPLTDSPLVVLPMSQLCLTIVPCRRLEGISGGRGGKPGALDTERCAGKHAAYLAFLKQLHRQHRPAALA